MMTSSSSRTYINFAPLILLLIATYAFYIHGYDDNGDNSTTAWQSTSRRSTTTTTTDHQQISSPTAMRATMLMFDDNHYHRLLTLLDEDDDLLPSHVFPLRYPRDYLGFGCAVIGLLLAAGGGIGGGGMLVPIYILLLQFPVKHAIPLASITVFGGAIANNVLNVNKCHPLFPQRPAIDWDLMVLLVPAMIAGAMVGAVLNKIFPDLLLAVLMLLMLTITAKETLVKAVKMYREEERVIVLQESAEKGHGYGDDEKRRGGKDYEGNNESSPRATEETPLIVNISNEMHLETDIINSTHHDSETIVDSNCFIENQHDRLHGEKSIRQQCFDDAIKLVTLFAIVVIVDVMQKIQSCGAYCHWGSELLLFSIITLFTHNARSDILARGNSCGPVSEICWDSSNTTLYPIFSIVAGLVAGMFGIGGGIIVGPLMLAIGVHPQVSSATSACMVLFTSATSTLTFIVFGCLRGDYATFCLLLGFLSTLLGQTVMSILLKWSGGRNSYIAFCVGGVVGISAIAMGVESAVAISKS